MLQQQISLMVACTIVVAFWRDKRLDQTFMKVVEKVPESALVLLSDEMNYETLSTFIQKESLIAKPIYILTKPRNNDSFFAVHWFCNPNNPAQNRFSQSITLSGFLKTTSPEKYEILQPWESACLHYLSSRQVNVSYNYVYPYSYK